MWQLYAPVALTLWREPFDRRLGEPQSRIGRCGEERKLFSLPIKEPKFSGNPARSTVTALTDIP
jgi:hypothetical protein